MRSWLIKFVYLFNKWLLSTVLYEALFFAQKDLSLWYLYPSGCDITKQWKTIAIKSHVLEEQVEIGGNTCINEKIQL